MQEMTYTTAGDYLIPLTSLPETPGKTLSKYGRMRQTYLREHREILYNRLLLSGKLTEHLTEIDETANRRLEQMMPKLMERSGVTEELKAQDPMRWTGQMNNLKAQAEEVILKELIYS